MRKRIKLVLIHITACISFLALPYLFFPRQENTFSLSNPATQRDFIGQALLVLFFYANYLVFIPKFYFVKKYFIFFFCVSFCLAAVIILPSAITQPPVFQPGKSFNSSHPPPLHADDNNFNKPPPHNGHLDQPPPHNDHFILDSPGVFLFFIIFFFSLNLRINNSRRKLQQEKSDAEISYLKAQINPHFLFNTLNSIYALSIEKSSKAPEAITKLADMMRYVLYQSQQNMVLLKNELDYINNYIQLQRIRFDEAAEISFSTEGDAGDKKIAPLLLIPFVENAFKYGVNADENSAIIISIKIEKNILQFYAYNKKVNRQVIEKQNGLGIYNTKQRLNLLYPARHTLIIADDWNEYTVSLKLDME